MPTPNSHGHWSAGLFHSGLLEIYFSSQSLVTKADEDSRSNGQKHDFVAVLEQFLLYISSVFLQLKVIWVETLHPNQKVSCQVHPPEFGDSDRVIAFFPFPFLSQLPEVAFTFFILLYNLYAPCEWECWIIYVVFILGAYFIIKAFFYAM